MGTYDPQTADLDNERETGNILNAMLKFPARYSFNVVGRTDDDESIRESFVDEVKRVILSESGDAEDDSLTFRVTPRGKKFTKVTIDCQVDSAAIITTIYKELEALERSVMQF